MGRRSTWAQRTAALAGATALVLGLALVRAGAEPSAKQVEFTDVAKQTREFIGYYHSLALTPEQEAIKKQALSGIAAPCCSDNTAYTCCCPCNMAKSNWGLSHYLIAELGYDAEQVRTTVSNWIRFINPEGFSGRACYSGGCMRAFEHDGCGGMDESKPIF